MSLSEEGIELVVQIIARCVELNEENEYLRQELRARRHQGDKWRLKAHEHRLKLEFIQIYLGEEKTVEEAIEEVGYTPRSERRTKRRAKGRTKG